MESPQTSKRKIDEGEEKPKVNSTPKNKRTTTPSDDFCLYGLHRESSPNFGSGQDVLEIGWGDSPEPLNMEQKYALNKTPVNCKKKLDTKESPRSSLPFKRRNVRSNFSLPSKPIIDVAKYVAEVQELSKSIMREFGAKKLVEDSNEDERLIACTQLIENSVKSTRCSLDSGEKQVTQVIGCNSEVKQNKDSAFDTVLQSFINEEDDWLSQALSFEEVPKTPCKVGFVKSRSENEISVPKEFDKKSCTQNFRNINNNFRRTSSFDMSKSQNHSLDFKGAQQVNARNSLDETNRTVQYSMQEIEKKRLEAKYRRERREIERKKLEALKRLEMKKLKVVKTQ